MEDKDKGGGQEARMEDVDGGRNKDGGHGWRTKCRDGGHDVRMEGMDGGQGIRVEDRE